MSQKYSWNEFEKWLNKFMGNRLFIKICYRENVGNWDDERTIMDTSYTISKVNLIQCSYGFLHLSGSDPDEGIYYQCPKEVTIIKWGNDGMVVKYPANDGIDVIEMIFSATSTFR